MEFGIFNLMGAREADKPTAQVFGEVAEQTKLADELLEVSVRQLLAAGNAGQRKRPVTILPR